MSFHLWVAIAKLAIAGMRAARTVAAWALRCVDRFEKLAAAATNAADRLK